MRFHAGIGGLYGVPGPLELQGFEKEWEAVRVLCAVGAIAGGGCLFASLSWEALFGTLYFAAFALMAMLGLFYRDPTREAGRKRKRDGAPDGTREGAGRPATSGRTS